MSGIKQPLQDILTKLATIQVTNQEGNTVDLYSRIWNNHVQHIKEGDDYIWPRPAAFVEIVNPVIYEVIGLGFRSADIGVRVHLIHDYYNADGTFEQDLDIFDLRDTIIMNLSQYCPTACGPLNCIREEQDFDHPNLYHYVLEFICNFTDSKGSRYDPAAGNYDETVNPDLDLEVIKDGIPEPDEEEQEFIISQIKTQ